ncbi:MAG: hypothetical protein LBE22_07250 [Azoarcus sp.]|jgi:hypothetical protein|nr:hypothetical protein [Azoarcus sp.]
MNNIRFWCVPICFAVLILDGCAVHRDNQGRYVISPDITPLLGEVVEERSMSDGKTVTLRKLNNQWSLKSGLISHVVPLGELVDAKIIHVDKVGEEVNVLLGTLSPTCRKTYQLISFGKNVSKASKWDIADTDCMNRDQPFVYVQTGENEQYLDVVRGEHEKHVVRFIYTEGELYRTRSVLLPKNNAALSVTDASKGRASSAHPASSHSPSAASGASSTSNIIVPAKLNFGKPVRQEKVVVDLM